MAGMFSLVDALFSVDMDEVVESVPNLSIQIKDALLQRKGLLGNMITLAQAVEERVRC
mgnify:FL=1